MRFATLALSLLAMVMFTVGCESPSKDKPAQSGKSSSHDHDGHDHDHDGHGHDDHGHDDHDGHGHDDHDGHDHGDEGHGDHAEQLGPNGGHLVPLTPATYAAEWQHYKGNSIIRVHVLDAEKKMMPVNATVTITPDAGKGDEVFELLAENAGDDQKAATYMADEQKLSIAMNLGVTLKIEIDGETYEGKIAPHKPHHH